MDKNFFNILYFVLKMTKTPPKDINIKNYYLFNRWLSMCDPSISIIINSITNRWLTKTKNIDLISFYRLLLPKYNKEINYIKKETKQNYKQDKNLQKIASNLELSSREIEEYEDMLDLINNKSK